MKVLLINIDSTIPNLALKKAERYHLDQEHQVTWNMPLMIDTSDVVYASCVFRENKEQAERLEAYDNTIIGGSGYDLHSVLPDHIEQVKPRINLGFTTRGCVRKCPFCIVPEKEGGIRIAGDLLDLWDGKSKDIIVLDNNILAIPSQFFKVCRQAITNKIRLDFNQGLDHRLLTPEMANALKSTRMKEYRFAYDSVHMFMSVDRTIDMLAEAGIREAIWYVLTGYNTTIHDDLYRLNHLRDRGHLAFVQRYEKKPDLNPIARWGNQRHLFRTKTFGEFLQLVEKAKYYIGIYGEEQYKRLVKEYS